MQSGQLCCLSGLERDIFGIAYRVWFAAITILSFFKVLTVSWLVYIQIQSLNLTLTPVHNPSPSIPTQPVLIRVKAPYHVEENFYVKKAPEFQDSELHFPRYQVQQV